MMDRIEERLPHDWLPDPSPPEDAPEWDARAARIMSVAPNPRTSWSLLGAWWKPAAALAAASVATLLLLDPGEPPSPALGVIAGDGEAAALWLAAGVEADPVLAIITLRAAAEER